MSRSVKCPTCKKRGDWFAGEYGPFCSHRCKLIDLGKWLGEEHAVSEPLPRSTSRSLKNFRQANTSTNRRKTEVGRLFRFRSPDAPAF